MKRIQILMLLLIISPLHFAMGQQYGWVKLNLDSIPGDPFFHGLYFTSDNTGWITTSSTNSIYRTDDGGATFTAQVTSLGYTKAVHMLDTNNGYSGGQSGWVYKTTSGGLNWNMLNSMGILLLDISFPPGTDPSNPVGYACGDNGQVWRIDSTMTNLNTGLATTFSGISAPSVNNVWFCGGNRMYFYNGSTFTSQSHPSGTFNDVYMINNMEGWGVGDAGLVCHTTSGGIPAWLGQNNPDTNQRSLYGVFAINSNEAWAVGNFGLILHTTNSGTTWNIEDAGLTNNDLHRVFFTSPTNGYVTGAHKTILKYTLLSGIENKEPLPVINIYPNPATSTLSIECPQSQNINVTIINLMGEQVMQLDYTGNKKAIDISTLPAGMYFARITVDKQMIVKKIIKQ